MLTAFILSKSVPNAFEFNLFISFWSALRFIFQQYRNKFWEHSWNFWWPFGGFFCVRDFIVLSTQHSSAKHICTCLVSASDSCAFLDQGQRDTALKIHLKGMLYTAEKTLMQPFQWLFSLPFQSNFWINKWTNKRRHPSPAVWQRHYMRLSLYGLTLSLVLWHGEAIKGYTGKW